MTIWLKHFYYVYAICLPGLALGALVVMNHPLVGWINLGSMLLFLFPLACYLSFTTEVVPFPQDRRQALWTAGFIPLELAITLWFSGLSLWYLFIMQATVELLGVLLLIFILVIQKLLHGDHQWFYAGILGLAILVGTVSSVTLLFSIVPHTIATTIGIIGSVAGIGYRYYHYLKGSPRNQLAAATNYLIIGLIATVAIPSVLYGLTLVL